LLINERVKAVRKALNLTQSEFGNKITLAQTYLSQIEKGDREVTEKIQKLICLTFNVDEMWLKTGEGTMFKQDRQSTLDRMSMEYNFSNRERAVFAAYLELSEKDRDAIMRYVERIAEKLSAIVRLDAESAAELIPDLLLRETSFKESKARKLEEYARELDLQEKAEAKSSVSLTEYGA